MTIERSTTKLDPEFRFTRDWMEGSDVKIGQREWPDAEAHFAMELLRTNGVLMGDRDGEDSAGRAAIKAMEPQKLVERALDISQSFYAEARKRGLMLVLPDDATIKAKVAENKAAARAEEEAEEERRTAKRAEFRSRATEKA